jgi:hypothetical protein
MSDALTVIAKTTYSWRVRNFSAAEREAEAILAALAEAGLVIVTRVPTMKMLNAAIDPDRCVYEETARAVYRAMVEAANEQ